MRVGSCCCGGCGRVLRMNLEVSPVCPYCGASDWSEVDEAALRAARNLTQGRLL